MRMSRPRSKRKSYCNRYWNCVCHQKLHTKNNYNRVTNLVKNTNTAIIDLCCDEEENSNVIDVDAISTTFEKSIEIIDITNTSNNPPQNPTYAEQLRKNCRRVAKRRKLNRIESNEPIIIPDDDEIQLLQPTEQREPRQSTPLTQSKQQTQPRRLTPARQSKQPTQLTRQKQPTQLTQQKQPTQLTRQKRPTQLTRQKQPTQLTQQKQQTLLTRQKQPTQLTRQKQPTQLTKPKQPTQPKQPEPSNVKSKQKEKKRTKQSRFTDRYSPIPFSNIYNVGGLEREGLREIVLDGSNIAFQYTQGKQFSVEALQIAIGYFLEIGHKVTAFVPQFRVEKGESTNPELLQYLVDLKLVILTPSKRIGSQRVTPYDDRYIIQYAHVREAIVVSNDRYKDLLKEMPGWARTIQFRVLMFTWIGDIIVFPTDPLGRRGPRLKEFLRFP